MLRLIFFIEKFDRDSVAVVVSAASPLVKYLALALSAALLMGSTLWSSVVLARNYGDHPAAQALMDKMVSEHNFTREELQKLFIEAEYKQSIVDAMTRPAEKVKLWKDYRKIFVTKKRIRQGVEFWADNRSTLERAQRDFGVDPAIIVAILGVETYYGRLMGGYRVIDALSTLAFDYPARSKFFSGELEHFLLLSREQNKKASELTGSYAGAMGYGQFIPSSYRNYAIDYTEDGFADIWDNPIDAIGSVANYFARHGWQAGQAVVVRARVRDDYLTDNINQVQRPEYNLNQLAEQGFSPASEVGNSVDTEMLKAFPLRLEGARGAEFWLAFDNFYVITRYNHSRRYAMAVYQLAEAIRDEMSD